MFDLLLFVKLVENVLFHMDIILYIMFVYYIQCISKFWKYNRIEQSNTPSVFRDLEIKWSKVF